MAERRRFAIEAAVPGAVVKLEEDETSHIRRVLRLKAGERIEGADGRGWIYTLVLRSGRGRRAAAEVVEKRRCPRTRPLHAIVAVGLLRGSRMDWAVEKAAELGARAFVPFYSDRTTGTCGRRVSRWRRISKSALKQSLAAYRMHVSEPREFGYILKLAKSAELALVGELDGPGLSLSSDGIPRGRCCLVAFGPEGGFSPQEAALLRDAGAIPFSLGPGRLRTETAVAAGLAALWQSASQLNIRPKRIRSA
jgi:16S rRNA (uracil1498-N3)-methyltransferase